MDQTCTSDGNANPIKCDPTGAGCQPTFGDSKWKWLCGRPEYRQPELPPTTCPKPVKCEQNPPYTHKISDQPTIIQDPVQPNWYEWPQSDCNNNEAEKSGCGDPIKQIPYQTVSPIVEVLEKGSSDAMKAGPPIQAFKDAQFTLHIDPPQPKQVELRLPEQKMPVRGPQRRWVQCVENELINDAVTRPLARPCHTRELPPIVIPKTEYERIKRRVGERERKRIECEEAAKARECEKLQSNYRHSLWNYTVDSLLEQKRCRENAKKEKEIADTKSLMENVRAEKEKESNEQIARAKKLMLHRKGLIRDFHAAMANSKMIKDIEDAQAKSDCSQNQQEQNKLCLQKMMWVNNNRKEYKGEDKTKKPCNPELIKLIQQDERRALERQAEIDKETTIANELRLQSPYPCPEKYKKYMAEPTCDTDDKCKKQLKMREEIWSEINDKLAVDAFIGAHENEIDRQACEFTHYKRTVDRMRKEKEEQLIVEKVNKNIAASERAAAVLVRMQADKKKRADEYNQLREKWEADIEEKQAKIEKAKEINRERAYADLERRKCAELCKQRITDPGPEWARQRLVAVENYEMECEINNTRRQKAEDLALYHKNQMAEKKCKELQAKRMDDIWACKMKLQYEEEMKELRDYAAKEIQDWEAKGRTNRPMIHAMKKWDYDAGMYPFPKVDHTDPVALTECQLPGAKYTYNTSGERLGFENYSGT